MKKILHIDENGIATVGKKAFEKHLPEGVTVEQVDTVAHALQNFSAAVFDEALSHATEHSKAVTVTPYTLGKYVSGSCTISEDFQAVNVLEFRESEEMAAVIKRSNELFINANAGADETPSDDDGKSAPF